MRQPSVQQCDPQGVQLAEFLECRYLVPALVQERLRTHESAWPRVGRLDLIVDFLGVVCAGSTVFSRPVGMQMLRQQYGTAGRVQPLCDDH